MIGTIRPSPTQVICIPDKPKHIVHVTEALGGGVLYLLHQLIKAQVDAGYKVTLIHSFKRETPAHEVLENLFPKPITRIVVPMTTHISPKADLRALREIAKLLKEYQANVVHLHSSKAGVLGRLAVRLAGSGSALFYSPHGFAFLKQDVSRLKRAIFFSIEVVAGLFGGKIIASCVTEGELANKVVGRRRVIVVENCTDVPAFEWPKPSHATAVQVMSAGRLCYQKAPWRFWNLSTALTSEAAHFYWVGDGELRKQLENDTTYKRITVSGWVDRDQLWREMYAADILVMTSLWEGMPLVLVDAQALGLPAVVTDVVGCRDVVQNGVTGFICKTDDELIEKTRLLIQDADLRNRMSESARNMATERFSIKRMHKEILEAYDLASSLEIGQRCAS